MKLNNWILDDETFYSEDWHWEYFPDIGIVSKSYCDEIFTVSRFNNDPYTDCPRCSKEDIHYNIKNKNRPDFKYKCKNCGHKFSITSGTYLDNTKLENVYWYRFAFLIADLKFPINSHALANSLGLTQKTTYYMLVKIKEAMNLESNGVVNGINFSLPENTSWWNIIECLLKLNPKIKNKEVVVVDDTEKAPIVEGQPLPVQVEKKQLKQDEKEVDNKRLTFAVIKKHGWY